MNREQIIAKWETLTPRERDAWVAEVVFDWEWRAPDEYSTGWYERVNNPPFYDRMHTGHAEDWSPTTDISAAWAVFNVIPGEAYMYRSDIDSSFVVSFGVSGHSCHDCGEDDFEITSQASAKTAPEAICLAVIIAKLKATV